MWRYPSSLNPSPGKRSSRHLISCRQRMSGLASFKKRATRSNRKRTELMFQVETRNVMGTKKAPNSGEGWALLRFHACAEREAGAGKLIPSARRGGTTDGDWHQPSNVCKIACVSLDVNKKCQILSLTVANLSTVRSISPCEIQSPLRIRKVPPIRACSAQGR